MSKFFKFIMVIAAIAMMAMSCTRINAGYEGIKVNLYGDRKGVDDVTLVTGMVQPYHYSSL